MRELNFTYLVLVVAAYMVGLGNLWKFPDLILRYGLGGFVVYLLSMIVIVGMIGAALETTKKKGYDILEYFAKEYGKPAFALLFLLFDLLLIGYYSIVGGWTLSSMLLEGAPKGITWNMGMGLAFIAILLLILLTGKRRTTDFMVVSFVVFLIISYIVMWRMYQAIGGESPLIEALKKTLEWKGISFRMSLEMASQASYSLGIGMGFYLALGSILPKKISGAGLVLVGAIIDTVMAIVGLIIVLSLLQMAPASATSGTVLLFSSLPTEIEKNLGPSMLYLFNISLFLAAITSMVPIGEVTGRITAEILRTSRENGVIISLSTATLVEIVTSLLIWLHFDSIRVLDETVSTFILFGGIIEAYAAVRKREYLPSWLEVWAWIGVVVVAFLGLYAFVSWTSPISELLLVTLALFALSLNGKLERKFKVEWRRSRRR